MRMKWFLIFIVFLLHIPAAIAQEQSTGNPFLDKPDTGWKEVPMANSNKVVMYNRASIVKDAQKDCRGVVIINTTLNSIIRLLEDTEVSHLWMHNCVNAIKVSEDDSKKESIKHFKTINRKYFMDFKNDSVVRNTIRKDDKTKVVTIGITSVRGLIPEDPEYTRIEIIYGKWVLEPKEDGVNVTYELYSEPSGWLARKFKGSVNDELLSHMLENLKSMKEVLECRHNKINCQRYNEGTEYVNEEDYLP